jgi:lysozyme family protein
MAQTLVKVNADGILGPKSINAINNCPNFVNLYTDLRVGYYNDLAVDIKYKKYLKGWLKRANSYRV